jgi:integrase
MAVYKGMTKPRTANQFRFPFKVEKNGRTGKIYKLGNGTFKTAFTFAGEPKQNTFKTPQAAFAYLDAEFSKLDTQRENALSLHPLNGNAKSYAELEQLLRDEGSGASLREAVAFYIAHHKTKRFKAMAVSACAADFVSSQRTNGITDIQIKTLQKHFRRFEKEFGSRKIHEILTQEISDWLGSQVDEKAKTPWSIKTRKSVRGSLVSLSIYARDILKAIPAMGDTEFQKVRPPKDEQREAVEIYTPAEFTDLLEAAIENDIDLIPALVVGGFCGLRPFEFHAEGLRRAALTWEAFNWNDDLLHVQGQKVRSKATRDIPLNPAAQAWLKPFASLTGPIWAHKSAHSKKMIALREKAKVKSVYDGFRHSYASYRIRQLKGNLAELAAEMGNSPAEIVNSYKRNVTDAEAQAWFGQMPPAGYAELIKAYLATLRN